MDEAKLWSLNDGYLTIRRALPSDAPVLCRWWNDGSIMAHAGFPRGLGVEVDDVANGLAKDDETRRRLILEASGSPIGEMSYRLIEDSVAEIGIKICETDRQERGLGTRYLQMLIRFLFDQRRVSRIVLDTNLNNQRAQHVYEKIGFRRVKINCDSWQDQNGQWQSSVDYAMTHEEYAGMSWR